LLSRILAALLHGTPAAGVEHRSPPVFGRATIMLGTGSHSIVFLCSFQTVDEM